MDKIYVFHKKCKVFFAQNIFYLISNCIIRIDIKTNSLYRVIPPYKKKHNLYPYSIHSANLLVSAQSIDYKCGEISSNIKINHSYLEHGVLQVLQPY